VVALPMVLDSEPRPIGQDIAVQIPSPGSGPYAPRAAGAPVGEASSAKAAARPTPPSEATRPGASADAGVAPGRDTAPAPARKPQPDPVEAGASAPDKAPAQKGGGTPPAVKGAPAAAPGDAALLAGASRPPSAATVPRSEEAAARERGEPARSPAAAGESPAVRPPPDTGRGEAPASAAPGSRATGAADADKADKSKGRPETFVIQLGAFADATRARDRHAQLQKAGIRSYTEVIKTPTGDKTRVRAGPFPTREAADQVNEKLKALGIADGVVVTRRY